MSAAGIPQQDIAAQLGKSVWWVGKWVGRQRESKSMTDLPRSGRPRKTTKEEDDRAVELLEQSEVGSLRRVKRKLGEEGINVCKDTIRQRALENARKYKKKPSKPLLTPAQKEKRLKFAKRELKKGATKHSKQYVFEDESLFEGLTTSPGQWVPRDEEPPPKPRVAHPPKVMVAGAISWFGKTSLIRIAKGVKMGADEYISTLEEGIVPDIQEIAGNEPWVLAHDGAPSHRAKKTQKWLKDGGFSALSGWPPNSPDLNPIENIWGIMKEEIQRQEPKTEEETWLAARRSWDAISLEYVRRLLGSWGRRLSAVVKSQGGHTKY